MGKLVLKGRHRLLCSDCRDPAAWERLLGGERVDAIVTDPPYGMAFRSNHRKVRHDAIKGDGDELLLYHAIGIDALHSRYVWCRWDNIPKSPRPTSVVTWAKNNWSMGDLEHEHARQTEVCLFYAGSGHKWPDKRPTDLVTHARTGNDLHPTQKPVSLLVEVVSWTMGIVGDPYCGSGTTIMACEALGRRCFACEIEPAYVDVCLRRYVAKYPDADPVRHDGAKWSELTE